MADRSGGCGSVNGRVIEPVLNDPNEEVVNHIMRESVDEIVDWMIQSGCENTVEALRMLRGVISEKLHEHLHTKVS